MIFIDSNVFVIDLRYKRDPLYRFNREFLSKVAETKKGATTIVNLLEVAGILSHNLSPGQLKELIVHFPTRYGIKVFPPIGETETLADIPVDRLVDIITKKCSLGDALIIDCVERQAKRGSVFITWDAKHFDGRIYLPVQTPKQYLKELA